MRTQRRHSAERLVAPFAQRAAVRREANLICRWQPLGREEGALGGIVAGPEPPANYRGSVQDDDAVLAGIVEVAVHAKEGSELDEQAVFLADLTPGGVFNIFAILEKTARHIPVTHPWLELATRQQDCPVFLDDASGRWCRIPIQNFAAPTAHAADAVIQLALRGRCTAC